MVMAASLPSALRRLFRLHLNAEGRESAPEGVGRGLSGARAALAASPASGP